MTVEIIVMYVLVGVVAGILAGLLGVGGGIVIVPMLVICFTMQKVSPELIMHMALGTSLASIMFTSISSLLSHHRRGAVDWGIFKRIVIGILLGAFIGSWIATLLPTTILKIVFCVFLYAVATQMILNKKPKASRDLPGNRGMFGVGSGIGVLSALVGIGGGSLSVPYMIWCNIPAHRAVGTSAAIGLPIAVSSACGFILNGLHTSGLPAYSIGFVYLPALAGIVCTSMLPAPLGARIAHALPVDKLKRVFALFLYLVATKMAWKLFS